MEIVIVNATRTHMPSGLWKADPVRASKADYLVEERNGKVYAVYEFTGVTRPNNDGRFSFQGLKDVSNSPVGKDIKQKLNLSRQQGEANPVRYAKI
ncbi:hypothetical protein [Treponema zioleckii]|uniref:hypothetical protein n=1 Tax=Treponema zioleckii TaxID=331680 RepID=UPI00168A5B38|nr:hypothetical protein [Treponema zioleckii]